MDLLCPSSVISFGLVMSDFSYSLQYCLLNITQNYIQ